MTHILLRRDLAATWASVNPVLMEGETGWEKDTGKGKMGDGTSAWNDLPYLAQKGDKGDPGQQGNPGPQGDRGPTGPAGGVNTVAGRQGDVTLAVADVSGAAPLASPTFTGDPKAPTPATTDNDTSIATTAFVKAAIAALVNGSPTTLDTLKELADALGDDPNFATTMTNALAAKAPLASPALTGTPTAPTQAAGTNNTDIATTAFVQGAINTAVPDAALVGMMTEYTSTTATSVAANTTTFVTGMGLVSGAGHLSNGECFSGYNSANGGMQCQVAGVYAITVWVSIPNQTTRQSVGLGYNSAFATDGRAETGSGFALAASLTVTVLKYLNVGDYIGPCVYFATAASLRAASHGIRAVLQRAA